jgi:hypothetical protein
LFFRKKKNTPSFSPEHARALSCTQSPQPTAGLSLVGAIVKEEPSKPRPFCFSIVSRFRRRRARTHITVRSHIHTLTRARRLKHRAHKRKCRRHGLSVRRASAISETGCR